MKKEKLGRHNSLLFGSVFFWGLLGLVVLALLLTASLYLSIDNTRIDDNSSSSFRGRYMHNIDKHDHKDALAPHLYPRLPYLPAFPTIDNGEELIHQTLHKNKPSIAGIAAILYRFLDELHRANTRLAKEHAVPTKIIQTYVQMAQKHLLPLDTAYQARPVFPIRSDDSIFVSVAAYREHLLADTLMSMYSSAANPQKLFVGVIVNNCFDTGASCQQGVKVVGKNKQGRDILERVDGVPDPNHIETFCRNATFQHYCDNGQVRVLYVDEMEAIGPAVARYYSSKLWGGETYYVQIDSHLHFANRWDELYIQDLQLCKSYPKAVLSTYPPGFVNFRQEPPFTPGTRLCRCQLRDMEGFLPRVEMEGRCKPDQERPTQMAFVGAGFFFGRAELLVDAPFDPFLPWLFMGEEIALSIRLWTHGWNIYAPRKNLIGHQYRPIKMGNPHYQDSMARLFRRPNLVNVAQIQVYNRIKYMIGYPNIAEIIAHGGDSTAGATVALDHYGVGEIRSRSEYLKFAEIDLDDMKCGPMKWCVEGTLD